MRFEKEAQQEAAGGRRRQHSSTQQAAGEVISWYTCMYVNVASYTSGMLLSRG